MKKITASFASSRSSFVLPYSDQKPTGIDTASDDYHKTVSYRAHNERHGMEMEVTAWQISKDCVSPQDKSLSYKPSVMLSVI